MEKTIRKLILFTILLSSTQVVTLPFGGISPFELMLLVTGMISALGIIKKGRIKRGKYLVFSAVGAFSSVIAFITSTNTEWARSYLLLGLMTSMLLVIIVNFFEVDDIPLLLKSLVGTQYITLIFSGYCFWKFYFDGGLENRISLFAGLYIELTDDFLRRGQAASQLRLSLPYATPPVLSVVMGMCLAIIVFEKGVFLKWKKWLLVAIFSIILLLTGSRTGVVALFAVLLIRGGLYLLKNSKLEKKMVFSCISVVVIALGFIAMTSDMEYVAKFINRFKIKDLLNDRHFLVPLDGIIIWTDSLKNFLLGIGFGSSANMMGAHTYLPPYFLNSFVTLLVERGIMGMYMGGELIRLSLSLYRKERSQDKQYKPLSVGLMVGLCACLFYEVLNCYFFIVLIAVCYLIDTQKETSGSKEIIKYRE